MSFLARNSIKLLVVAALSLLLAGCEAVGYYSQAVRGQLQILLGRQSIARLLQREDLDGSLRRKFTLVLELREFAELELGLPAERNYASYVNLDREHVVWNVFAAPEFSTTALNWCYPIAGCVSYRGYFSEAAAERFAAGLEQEGFDVYTGGVDAYSTLGWFQDPLLSTFIDRSEYQLAGLIFHELAHQIVYKPGDTTFNESFATAVEREGQRRWLQQRNRAGVIDQVLDDAKRREEFAELVIGFQQRFADLYAQDLSATQMRVDKRELQDEMRAAYSQLKQGWDGYGGFDAWFDRPLNNAQLSTVSAYNGLLPLFNRELDEQDGDLLRFYERVDELAKLPEDKLNELVRLTVN